MLRVLITGQDPCYIEWCQSCHPLSPKTFSGPKFELPGLKILTTWNVHIVHIVEFCFAILQLYIGVWRISSHCNKMLIEKRRCTCTLVHKWRKVGTAFRKFGGLGGHQAGLCHALCIVHGDEWDIKFNSEKAVLRHLVAIIPLLSWVRPMAHYPNSLPKNWYQNLCPETLLMCHAFRYQIFLIWETWIE